MTTKRSASPRTLVLTGAIIVASLTLSGCHGLHVKSTYHGHGGHGVHGGHGGHHGPGRYHGDGRGGRGSRGRGRSRGRRH